MQQTMTVAHLSVLPCRLQFARLPVQMSREKVLRELAWVELLSDETFAMLLNGVKERIVKPGDYLVRQGEYDEYLYLVLEFASGIIVSLHDGTQAARCLSRQLEP